MPAIPWLNDVPLEPPTPAAPAGETQSDTDEPGRAVIDSEALPGLANWLEWRRESWVTQSN